MKGTQKGRSCGGEVREIMRETMCETQPQRGCVLCRDSRDTTPLGLMICMAPIPKVALADSGNLGLDDKTPLGFFLRR